MPHHSSDHNDERARCADLYDLRVDQLQDRVQQVIRQNNRGKGRGFVDEIASDTAPFDGQLKMMCK